MATYSLIGWEKYQHYGKRDSVPWVKLHRDTLTSPCWIKGSDLERTLMVGSMMLAGRYSNAIPLEWEMLQPTLALKCSKSQFMMAIRYLDASGFIAICEQGDSKELDQEEKSRGDKNPPKSPKGDEHESFSEFWKAYPSRGKAANPRKPAASAHLAAIKRGADPAELIRLAPTAAPAEKHGTEFVPQSTTWLNEDRWKDAPEESTVVNLNSDCALWKVRLEGYRRSKFWREDLYGPTPDEPGCKAPTDLIDEILNLTMAG